MGLSFHSRLLPAPLDGGFRQTGYWVWCGSVIRADEADGGDGRYHMFASRWPSDLEFSPHWLTNSEVVRASSDTPEGPYRFEEVVLRARGAEWWDGRMTHNPTIHRWRDTWLLYYTGTTYAADVPTPERPLRWGDPTILEARMNQRIGLATAPSVFGPWTRRAAPALEPRPGMWDGAMTTNPAPCVDPDGRVLLIYKAVAGHQDLLRLGAARAEHFDAPFERLADEPIFRFDDSGDHVEDAYVWRGRNGYELVMKDMRGGICGESGAGIHAISADGVRWTVSEPPLAYSRQVRWDDGSTTVQAHLERPQLLVQDGKPTHLFLATMDGTGGFQNATRSWNLCLPLR